MKKKAIVYRIGPTGRHEYLRTKCSGHWTSDVRLAHLFCLRSAREIAERYQSFSRGFYTFHFQEVPSL